LALPQPHAWKAAIVAVAVAVIEPLLLTPPAKVDTPSTRMP
jgi:hypothetical protein